MLVVFNMSLKDDFQNPKFNIFKQKKTKVVNKHSSDVMDGTMSFENGIKMLIGKEFGGMSSGFSVNFEGRKFRPSQFNNIMLESIKDQLAGYQPKIAEITLYNKYLCDVDESMKPAQVIQIISQAIIKRII